MSTKITEKDYYGISNAASFRDGLLACLTRTHDRKPLVTLNTCIGLGAEFTPDQLRELAAKFLEMAEDAAKRPTKSRLYYSEYRKY